LESADDLFLDILRVLADDTSSGAGDSPDKAVSVELSAKSEKLKSESVGFEWNHQSLELLLLLLKSRQSGELKLVSKGSMPVIDPVLLQLGVVIAS